MFTCIGMQHHHSKMVSLHHHQSAKCVRFHQCRRLVADLTIGEVSRGWLVVRKDIGDVGWLTKKILERIGRKFQKCRTLDVNNKNTCTWNKLPNANRSSEQPSDKSSDQPAILSGWLVDHWPTGSGWLVFHLLVGRPEGRVGWHIKMFCRLGFYICFYDAYKIVLNCLLLINFVSSLYSGYLFKPINDMQTPSPSSLL